MVNQIEVHPDFQQSKLCDYCKKKNIAVTSWSPLGQGQLLSNPTLTKIAEKHKRTVAQVIIRWHVQLGLIVIPKSVNHERIKANFDVFSFELDESDLQTINAMEAGNRVGPDPKKFFHI
ncbi:aldo/keto reductase [Strigomonas culicis]|nr:aldo/keto reductase [Strigomonas culicis]|eukprot:EPY19649.1 aldo/keto reductase [Strigomonas culicis]